MRGVVEVTILVRYRGSLRRIGFLLSGLTRPRVSYCIRMSGGTSFTSGVLQQGGIFILPRRGHMSMR